jgi:hypothetical protein
MLRSIILSLSLFLCAPVFSVEHRSRVHALDVGAPTDEVVVLLANGRVAFAGQQDQALLELLRRSEVEGLDLAVEVGPGQELLSARELPPGQSEGVALHKQLTDPLFYPSVISSFDEARRVFELARKGKTDSQCYQRAHVWSYEWRVKERLFSNKLWLFFTPKYLRENRDRNFEWWFHVAPSMLVNVDGELLERVFDPKYFRSPVSIKRWTDHFMAQRPDCPLIETYSHYADYPESGSCFLQRSSMYYYRPVDLEILEKFGTRRNRWEAAEVIESFAEAFGVDLTSGAQR